MWCRRGSRTAVNKPRQPELSPMSRQYTEKQKQITSSLSPPPSTKELTTTPSNATAGRPIPPKQETEENWGKDEVAKPRSNINSPVASPIRSVSPTEGPRLPAPDHPIWGEKGIMHCLALKPGNKITYIIDPRYGHRKRYPKVFGHNGIEPGMWWPYQMLAHFWGAHGSPMSGITGDPKQGAFSIVISGSSSYSSMDQDFGDQLYYSADNSQDNANPNRILYTSSRTESLHASLKTGRPVRVLRSSGGKKAYTPKAGIRYDGLYRVSAVREVTNKLGGLYAQFELIRLPGQRSLDEINRTVPSKQQQADFAKIKNKY